MPAIKRRKSSQTPTNIKRIKGNMCNIGFCANETKEHICRLEREIGVQAEKITFVSHIDTGNNDKVYYFDTIWQRLFYTRLFQTNTDPFNNLELHNITIHLKLMTYYSLVHGNTYNLPTKQDNTIITTLLSPIMIHFHIVEICDLKLRI
ncbi:hypothetical protein F8M41_021978 [Gigaspora margarita]|uniref:Uncharacterized protein n=1 Tax=Gigaspora margarita TaxID=4874 RepID=A0A8H4EID9_GIGMA|nr:hypothetical protein F8M41_021978 [Gigaspora margarita]